mmetsp:Transcript_4803/g.10595  ORF Transcript_4803/g.10595 Transcript_4803/m.10595 type:complete len:221 (+) Transcript_4803:533-1195(+)
MAPVVGPLVQIEFRLGGANDHSGAVSDAVVAPHHHHVSAIELVVLLGQARKDQHGLDAVGNIEFPTDQKERMALGCVVPDPVVKGGIEFRCCCCCCCCCLGWFLVFRALGENDFAGLVVVHDRSDVTRAGRDPVLGPGSGGGCVGGPKDNVSRPVADRYPLPEYLAVSGVSLLHLLGKLGKDGGAHGTVFHRGVVGGHKENHVAVCCCVPLLLDDLILCF